MMKKLFVLFLFVIAMVSFSGCGKVIELTDEEYYMIAEYSADLLIKYDKDIKSKYNEAYMESLIVTDVSTEEITTTEVASNDTTEVTEVITEETTVSVTEATFSSLDLKVILPLPTAVTSKVLPSKPLSSFAER